MITFAWPWCFILLLLPFIHWRWRLAPSIASTPPALRVPFFTTLLGQQSTTPAFAQSLSWRDRVLPFFIWCALITALARPEWLGEMISLPSNGRDILLAVDTSGSMETPDMQWQGQSAQRFTVIQQVANEFIAERTGDRIGLILFGSGAYLQTPLTYDLTTAQQFLSESVVGIAGEQTAIGDAIGLAIKQVKDIPTDKKILILLTDGSNNTGVVQPLEAAQEAKKYHLQIYTIGVGADTMQVQTLFGVQVVPASRDLDEKLLKEIATITGGQYFRATDTKGLREIYETINSLEKIDADNETFRPITSLFHWPLGVAMCGILLLLVLRALR